MKTDKLEKLDACREAKIFVATQKSAISAWKNCSRGDWMLWIASKLGIDKRLLTLAKAKCAATVLHLMKDQRSKDAVQAAIDYGEGRINDQQLAAYAAAAYATDAAYAAYAADAAAAAYAAAAAAYAAAADAAAAYAAATDAAYAYAAYAYAAAADAKTANQLATANICREILTAEVLKAYKNLKV